MHEGLLLVVDYEKICRLCLNSTGAMWDIFEYNSETSLRVLILCATGLEVQKDDGLPSKICHKCLFVVELGWELRCKAEQTHKLLTEAAGSDIVPEYLDNTDTQEDKSFNYSEEDTKQELNDLIPQDHKDEKQNIDKKEKPYLPKERVRRAAPKHLTCQICLSSFTAKDLVYNHVETHYADSNLSSYLELKRPYECEACKNGALTQKQLVLHHREHLGVNPYTCKHPGCDFVGKNRDALRHHSLKHGARSQVCESCGAAFRRRWELHQHALRVHAGGGGGPLPCRDCRPRKVFRNYLSFKAHLKMHHQPPRYQCDWRGCPKAYHSRVALTAHRRAHADERAYKCHLCAAATYTSQSLLNRHLRLHERARISKCDKCPATFDDYGAFYRHRVTAHGPWQPHRCLGCNQGYQKEAQLEKHLQKCELALRMKLFEEGAVRSDPNDNKLIITSIQELPVSEKLQENPLDKFKGQSVLVQPGNINDLSKDSLVLQGLPPDGLLYIEVEPDNGKEHADNNMWRQ